MVATSVAAVATLAAVVGDPVALGQTRMFPVDQQPQDRLTPQQTLQIPTATERAEAETQHQTPALTAGSFSQPSNKTMQNASNIVAAAVVPLSGAIGGKLGFSLATLSPEMVAANLLGPLGFLVGCIIAIKWLTKRLERSENAQAENLKTLTEINIQTKTVIEQNSELLKDVKYHLEKR